MLQTLAENMASIMRCVHAGHGFHCSGFFLRPIHARILLFIERRETVALKDLAEWLNVTPGAVTQMVDALAGMGLVQREEDTKDRRIIRIRLTGLALDKLEELKKGYLTSVSRVFGVLSDMEIEEFVMLLNKVHANLGRRKK